MPPKKYHKPYRSYSLFPKPLSKGMMSPVANVLKKRGFEHEAILHYWSMAAGELLSTHSAPIRLKQDRNGRYSQLIVRVHPAYSAILQHECETILRRLSRYLGYRPADRITIIHSTT